MFDYWGPLSAAGQFSNNRAWSVGASYMNDPLKVAAAYLQLNNLGSTNTGAVALGNGDPNVAAALQRTYGVGASYAYGPANVGFVLTRMRFDNVQGVNLGG